MMTEFVFWANSPFKYRNCYMVLHLDRVGVMSSFVLLSLSKCVCGSDRIGSRRVSDKNGFVKSG